MAESNASLPDWLNSSQARQGTNPRGLKLSQLEFGSTKSGNASSSLERLGLEELIGASVFESANLKANHVAPGVLTGTLADTMSHIETKFHEGTYDAAATPLIEQYLAEMRNLALIQKERNEIFAERVADIKEAKYRARKAVDDARKSRAQAIRSEHEAANRLREEKKQRKEDGKRQKLELKRQRKSMEQERKRMKQERKTMKEMRNHIEFAQLNLGYKHDEPDGPIGSHVKATRTEGVEGVGEATSTAAQAQTAILRELQRKQDEINVIGEEIERVSQIDIDDEPDNATQAKGNVEPAESPESETKQGDVKPTWKSLDLTADEAAQADRRQTV